MKARCIVCGIETAQGGICALCNAGITRMHDELMKLMKTDEKQNIHKKLNIRERKQRFSLN
jgi:predicted Fe-S protein YdhL (DUF1289 family)